MGGLTGDTTLIVRKCILVRFDSRQHSRCVPPARDGNLTLVIRGAWDKVEKSCPPIVYFSCFLEICSCFVSVFVVQNLVLICAGLFMPTTTFGACSHFFFFSLPEGGGRREPWLIRKKTREEHQFCCSLFVLL